MGQGGDCGGARRDGSAGICHGQPGVRHPVRCRSSLGAVGVVPARLRRAVHQLAARHFGDQVDHRGPDRPMCPARRIAQTNDLNPIVG
eukprot:gene371-470_t